VRMEDADGHSDGPENADDGDKQAAADRGAPDQEEAEHPSKADRTEKENSPLKKRPSYGGFDNLADEIDSRAQSHKNAEVFNKSNGSGLNEEAIAQEIDPYGPDIDKVEGHKESFQRTFSGQDSEWTEGVDKLDDLPAGERLLETDDDERSRLGNLRSKLFSNASSIDDRVQKISTALDKAFGQHPPGHAEIRTNNGPVVYESHPSGIDAGSTASALLTLGIVGAEATRRVVRRIGEWRNLNGEGDR
jgi:hypothetical protein